MPHPKTRLGPLTLELPAGLVEELTARVLERVLEQLAVAEPASPWMTVEQAAGYLAWPRERLYKLSASRAIPHRKHENRILFRRDELDAWLDGYREGPGV